MSFLALKELMHNRLLSTTKFEAAAATNGGEDGEEEHAAAGEEEEEEEEGITTTSSSSFKKLLSDFWSILSSSSSSVAEINNNKNKEEEEFIARHQLDACFIHPRVVVAGPARAQLNDQDRYRNDACKLLEAFSDKHVLFVDLSKDQSRLDLNAIHFACLQFDLERPTLAVLHLACQSVLHWLERHDNNMVILTCSNGIKTSCLLASILSQKLRAQPTVEEGVKLFFDRRLHKKNWTYSDLCKKLPPSYHRLWKTCRSVDEDDEEEEEEEEDVWIHLTDLLIKRLPNPEKLPIKITVRGGPGFRSLLLQHTQMLHWTGTLLLRGDVVFDISVGSTLLCSLPLHTNFHFRANSLVVGPDAMDECRKHALPGDFELRLKFDEIKREAKSRAVNQGQQLCSQHHVVRANSQLVKRLLDEGRPIKEEDAVFFLQLSNNDYALALQLVDAQFPPPTLATQHTKRLPLTPLHTNNNNNTPNKDSGHKIRRMHPTPKSTPASLFQTVNKVSISSLNQEEENNNNKDDHELNQFLKQTIGTGLLTTPSKKSSPNRRGGSSTTSTNNLTTGSEQDLFARLSKLLKEDPDKLERLLRESSPLKPPTPPPVAAKSSPPVTKPSSPHKTTTTTTEESSSSSTVETLGNHETYGTFFKMLKCGVPREGVEQKMKQGGFLVRALDLGPLAPVSALFVQGKVGDSDVFGKYFKMLKCGVPAVAVKQRMDRDAVCSAVLDLGENASLEEADQLIQQKQNSKPTTVVKGPAKKKKTRSIRWDAIPQERLLDRATIWSSAHDDGSEEVRTLLLNTSSDLEDLFVTPAPTAAAVSMTSSSSSTNHAMEQPNKGISVLDGRRAQSVSIGMAKLKLAGEELRVALEQMDTSVLTQEHVQVIQGCSLFPSAEEHKLLSKHTGGGLNAPDQFLKVLPLDASVRVDALAFRFSLHEHVSHVTTEFSKISLACVGIQQSGSLKDLLRTVLVLGNQINGEEDYQINAFTLASLLKLSQTKSVNRKVNVLEFLVSFLMKKSPSVLQVVQDLECVNGAKRIDLLQCAKHVGELERHLGSIAEKDFPRFSEFCASARVELAHVVAQCEQAKLDFARVLDYLGEDRNMTSMEFFSTLSSFLSSLSQTRTELEEREKRTLRKQQQLLQQQQQQSIKSSSSSSLKRSLHPVKAVAAPPPPAPSSSMSAGPHPHLSAFLMKN